MSEKWKTIHEVSESFNIKLSTLRNFVNRGNYLGEHEIGINKRKIVITEQDKRIKLIHGKKTTLLSPNFVDFIAERFGIEFPVTNHLRRFGKQTLKSLKDPTLSEGQFNYLFYKFQKEITAQVRNLEEQLRNHN
ncbi:hypothetical protein [Limosilactobacillus reuteri]|uniref:hypothetical protein n=1 Tax=Limosilactobacillus reuteri TaxID=1598 RepID=UPI001E5E0037|nr:hypothetical protein [Limosilactobacillus reuteri]MCC4439357.1 hypothetical protein [Limosilactobacillus reuteri]